MVYFDDIFVFSHNRTNHVEHLRSVLKVMLKNKLYVNLKKCSFMINKLLFFNLVIEADEEKVRAIHDQLIPKTISDMQSFHSLTTFYRRFIQNFSSIMALINECLKKKSLSSIRKKNIVLLLNEKLCNALVLVLPNFNKLFEVGCDACGVGIKGVLSYEKHHIPFFSEKLNEARLKQSPMIKKKLYNVLMALKI